MNFKSSANSQLALAVYGMCLICSPATLQRTAYCRDILSGPDLQLNFLSYTGSTLVIATPTRLPANGFLRKIASCPMQMGKNIYSQLVRFIRSYPQSQVLIGLKILSSLISQKNCTKLMLSMFNSLTGFCDWSRSIIPSTKLIIM